MTIQYAFTLRKTNVKKTPATEKIYEAHMRRVFSDNGCPIIDYGFEPEKGLHVHGIVEIRDALVNRQKVFRIRGWRLHLTLLTDAKGWIRYYNKNKHRELKDKLLGLEYQVVNGGIDEVRVKGAPPSLEQDAPSDSDWSDFMEYREHYCPRYDFNIINT